MEQNELKLEDCFLTYEQVKELQELGVDMSKSCLLLYRYGFPVIRDSIERTLKQAKKMGLKVDEYIPTLTNTEMLEMLPENLFGFDGYDLQIIKERNNTWTVRYCKYDGKNKVFYDRTANKLRDALFEMIKRLKFNKLM